MQLVGVPQKQAQPTIASGIGSPTSMCRLPKRLKASLEVSCLPTFTAAALPDGQETDCDTPAEWHFLHPKE